MYGLIKSFRARPGQGTALAQEMTAGGLTIAGLRSFIVAVDARDAEVIWVTEMWDDEAAWQASFDLPAVKDSIARGMALIAGVETQVVTRPVAGTGVGAGDG